MIAGILGAMQCDFAALSPTVADVPTGAAYAIAVVHLLRRHVLCGAIGFCFAPSAGRDHGINALRRETSTATDGADMRSVRLSAIPWLRDANVKELPIETRAEMARSSIVGSVHVLLASLMLSGLPALELMASGYELWFSASSHVTRALSGDPCGVAWCTIMLLRLLHIATINVCLSIFLFHFTFGFFSQSRHHSFKGFWADYSACRLFAQLMLLSAMQTCFSWPHNFDAQAMPLRVAALTFAAAHAAGCLTFCLRNGFLVLRNIEYGEAQLAEFFTQSRIQEAAVEMLMDAQLAFLWHIQAQLHQQKGAAPPRAPYRVQLLFRQLLILARFKEATEHDLPVPSSNPPVPSSNPPAPSSNPPAPSSSARRRMRSPTRRRAHA